MAIGRSRQGDTNPHQTGDSQYQVCLAQVLLRLLNAGRLSGSERARRFSDGG
jgi:hypothetical protein